ncbi:MAG: hypothetical protein ABEJ72_01965 [Candidatus Aenigmatarchaeota archaeon]
MEINCKSVSHYEEQVSLRRANIDVELEIKTLYGGNLEEELQAVVYTFPDVNGQEEDICDFVDYGLEAYDTYIGQSRNSTVVAVTLSKNERVEIKDFAEKVTGEMDKFLGNGGFSDILD